MGSIKLVDGCMLKTKPLSKGVKLEKGKSLTDITLRRGLATKEARVAWEST